MFFLQISNDLFPGKDVLAKARTGTGKTVAFLVMVLAYHYSFSIMIVILINERSTFSPVNYELQYKVIELNFTSFYNAGR